MNRASLDHTVSPGPEWSKLAPIQTEEQEEEKSCRRCVLMAGAFLVAFWGGVAAVIWRAFA